MSCPAHRHTVTITQSHMHIHTFVIDETECFVDSNNTFPEHGNVHVHEHALHRLTSGMDMEPII